MNLIIAFFWRKYHSRERNYRSKTAKHDAFTFPDMPDFQLATAHRSVYLDSIDTVSLNSLQLLFLQIMEDGVRSTCKRKRVTYILTWRLPAGSRRATVKSKRMRVLSKTRCQRGKDAPSSISCDHRSVRLSWFGRTFSVTK